MSEVVLSQSCSELNNADSKDCIDVNKIMEQESKKSSQFYVESFKTFAVKTAQSTIEMCRVVAEAKKYLTKDRFQSFCTEIGHEKEDATIRKYIVIGNHYERFIKYVELLPNSWTSIYLITQLPPEAFDAFALTGNSMANMTGAQLKALMAPPASAEKSKANVGKSETLQPTAVDTSTDAASATEPQQQSQPIEQSNAAAESDDAANSANAAASDPAAPASAQLSVSANKSSMSVPSADARGDESSATPSDHEFAKQATSKVVADARAASTANDADAEDAFVPYGIVLRFNSKPPEAAAQELTEMIISIKAKYCLDLDIKSEELIAV